MAPDLLQQLGLNRPAFRPFEKIARLSRDMVITEKIDGTNGVIYIPEIGDYVDGVEKIIAGSRNRWLDPVKGQDNFGFASWVQEHREELLTLGPGYHYGEWWGAGIQRGYGLDHKRFSVFNPFRYKALPPCVHVVPILAQYTFDLHVVDHALADLRMGGSVAAPGFMDPEGVVVYHVSSKTLFKKTIEGDEKPKGAGE